RSQRAQDPTSDAKRTALGFNPGGGAGFTPRFAKSPRPPGARREYDDLGDGSVSDAEVISSHAFLPSPHRSCTISLTDLGRLPILGAWPSLPGRRRPGRRSTRTRTSLWRSPCSRAGSDAPTVAWISWSFR